MLFKDLKHFFTRLARHIWKYGEEKLRTENDGNIMIQKFF